MTLFSLTEFTKLSWLNTSLEFLQKRNFLERWETELSSHNVYVTFFVYTEHLPLIILA